MKRETKRRKKINISYDLRHDFDSFTTVVGDSISNIPQASNWPSLSMYILDI